MVVCLWAVDVPLPPASVQLPPQLARDGLQVHEVTEATTSALPVEASGGIRQAGTQRNEVFLTGLYTGRDTDPISYWRQHASRKSVTGESSAWMGCALNQRLFRSITAFSASSSRRNCDACKSSKALVISHMLCGVSQGTKGKHLAWEPNECASSF